MKSHLKRHFAPKAWPIKKKESKFITRAEPGPHSNKKSAPLNVILRDVLHLSSTTRESKNILNKKEVLVDGIRRKSHKFPVGLFDVVSFPELDKSYRVVLNNKGKIVLIAISKQESSIKPCKIANKTPLKGKVQLNLNDGKNIIVEKSGHRTGDTVLIEIPKLTVKKHLNFKKNVLIYLTGGRHISETGKVKDIVGNRIMYTGENGDTVETLKKYAFVIGEDKESIKVKQS